jgi:hypothetical protein
MSAVNDLLDAMRTMVVRAEVVLDRFPDANPNLEIHAEDLRLICTLFREAELEVLTEPMRRVR